MRRGRTLLAGAVLLFVVSGCSQELGGPGTTSGIVNDDPDVLRTKIDFLQADQCFAGDLARVFPYCGKFITQLDSTTGTVDELLAPNSAAAGAAARELRSGVDSYQRARCDIGATQPSETQQQQCPAALQMIRNGLGELGSG